MSGRRRGQPCPATPSLLYSWAQQGRAGSGGSGLDLNWNLKGDLGKCLAHCLAFYLHSHIEFSCPSQASVTVPTLRVCKCAAMVAGLGVPAKSLQLKSPGSYPALHASLGTDRWLQKQHLSRCSEKPGGHMPVCQLGLLQSLGLVEQ